MKDSECLAKQIIEQLIEGVRLTYREIQDSGQYDFDFQYLDGSLAALEVTVSADIFTQN